MSNNFRMFDTRKADGCYVTFEREILDDDTASPNDTLFQDEDYREEDQARLDAYNNGEWQFIGIRAIAHIQIIANGIGATFRLESPGLFGIEDDSGEEYLDEAFAEECDNLKGYIAKLQSPIYS